MLAISYYRKESWGFAFHVKTSLYWQSFSFTLVYVFFLYRFLVDFFPYVFICISAKLYSRFIIYCSIFSVHAFILLLDIALIIYWILDFEVLLYWPYSYRKRGIYLVISLTPWILFRHRILYPRRIFKPRLDKWSSRQVISQIY